MDSITPEEVPQFSKDMLAYIHSHAAQSVDQIKYRREMNQETEEELNLEIGNFISQWEKKVKRIS